MSNLDSQIPCSLPTQLAFSRGIVHLNWAGTELQRYLKMCDITLVNKMRGGLFSDSLFNFVLLSNVSVP